MSIVWGDEPTKGTASKNKDEELRMKLSDILLCVILAVLSVATVVGIIVNQLAKLGQQ